jgi:hypothetical protein
LNDSNEVLDGLSIGEGVFIEYIASEHSKNGASHFLDMVCLAIYRLVNAFGEK